MKDDGRYGEEKKMLEEREDSWHLTKDHPLRVAMATRRFVMGKRRFSGLEVTLMVMFSLMFVVAIALIVLFVTGEGGVVTDESTEIFVPHCPNIPLAERVDCFPDAGASKRKASPSLFGADIAELSFHAEMQTNNRLHFKISDAHKQRFEVPHEHISSLNSDPSSPISNTLSMTTAPFGLVVRRKETKKVLFDTTMAPLVFADQYLQISAKLPSHNIYGLGEHVHKQFRHDTNWKTWPIFTRDAFPNGGTHNLYGHYPFFLCLEDESGKSFGVFLMNSNAMEVTLQPAPAVTFRTIGGVLDFYILFGDTPEQVVQEFLELIGRPVIPPYWSLGFQLSRWNYGSLKEVKDTDVQYTDIDYMEDKKDFTYDKVNFNELPQFADYLHEKGQKYILILAFDRGTAQKAWITDSDGETPLLGEVWPGETVFPDYTSQNCMDWWVDEYERFSREIKHDALWIDMNEVASFVKGSNKGCARNNLNYPPYTPKILDEVMYSKTLCMDAKQAWGNHYDVHSVGKYSGHWLGDNAANWNDIKWAIPGMLEFGLFGVPYIGADICGFFDDTSEELCRRWMQVGAFYPFSRNHNAEGFKPQDPAVFGSGSTLLESSKHYLTIRYTLLPYLYTLFYKAHTTGETVVRPVMHEFFSDSNTWTGKDRVWAYIPDAVWYNYETMERLTGRRNYVDMYLPADKLGLHIRGGAILPTQRPDVTTTYSRRHPMGLIVALDDNNQAAGELFWDDGDSRVLSMRVNRAGYKDPNNLFFENITVLGVAGPPTSVSYTLVGNVTTAVANVNYDAAKKVMFLTGLSLIVGQSYLVEWEVEPNEHQRFDCYPGENTDEANYIERAPWCFYPKDYGYNMTTSVETDSGMTFDISRNNKYRSNVRPGSPDINTLRVDIRYHKSDMLQFKIWDPNTERYEVPVPLSVPATPETDEAKRLYKVQFTDNPFGIQVIRKSTGTKIWDSSLPGFTFSEMFIQVSTRLSSEYVYGFGETEHATYRHNLNYHTWGMFAKDQPPGYKMNCYGVHPFYMGLEDTADAHGVLLLNSNAMDVTFQPTPSITYRTLGGILDFYMVLGPTPEMVVQEYTADVQYADIDYMERQLNFVLDSEFKGLPALVNTMRGEGMRFIFILDPAISGNEPRGDYPAFDRGLAQDVFIKYPKNISDEIVWGKDMNEPASFVHGTVGGNCLGNPLLENPPYMPPLESKHRGLNHKTLCMNSEQILSDGKRVLHYDVHNLYGWSQTKSTYESTYPSSGKWAGHWLGDNYSSWDQLFKSIIGMMEFSLFGISYTGADICGFFNDGEYEMCLRWMQLGAFYPYSRNHNGKRQDPVAWDDNFAQVSRDVLNIRYTLLPYLYTLMFEAHTKGSTVVRPLLHEESIMWTAMFLTHAGIKCLKMNYLMYFQAKDVGVRGKMVSMPTPLDHINLHIRGGYLPWQKPENTTLYSRRNPLGLIVALSDSGTAQGSFFWDDGEGIATQSCFSLSLVHTHTRTPHTHTHTHTHTLNDSCEKMLSSVRGVFVLGQSREAEIERERRMTEKGNTVQLGKYMLTSFTAETSYQSKISSVMEAVCSYLYINNDICPIYKL
ncbi:hypothetical protein F7725_021053 [Dissostichus mawsoni]|uniref:alpha-glucosidase n=1 Tax=Dissostichus mawsoni TaxID=36200 RepID=A0A7J5YF09_DISMA|nr:hypothetical protein F7725_021053 [Dissostichus mawsoni]